MNAEQIRWRSPVPTSTAVAHDSMRRLSGVRRRPHRARGRSGKHQHHAAIGPALVGEEADEAVDRYSLLMATIDSSIVLIALPDIFRGIGINPLDSGNASYLLWMVIGISS